MASQNMESIVSLLSEESIRNGGSGKVDIVAHSMGGLIARYYLNTQQGTNKINKVISIATPYQGSFWLAAYDQLGLYGQLTYDYTFSRLVQILISADPSNPGPREMIPGNYFLTNLNASNYDSDIRYVAIYGSYTGVVLREIFNLTLISDSKSLGDFVVGENSASTISSNRVATRYKFSETDPLRVLSYIQQEGNGYEINVVFPKLNLFRYNHLDIIKQPEVKSVIIKNLIK